MNTSEEKQEELIEAEETVSSQLIPRRDFLTKSLVTGLGVMGLGLLDELPAYAASLDPKNPLALPNNLHACGLAESGIIWHTIRFSGGNWQSSFGNVNAQESNSGLRFKDVDCAGIGGKLHVCGLGREGIIWHTIRFSGGNWQPSFGNVNAQESNSGLRFTDIGCAGTASSKLHVCGLAESGIIWHTIRFSGGNWQSSFGNVNAQESNSGLRFKKVDCATVGEDLHVCGIDESGIIWHTIRFSGGNWQSSFGNVNAQESNGNLRFQGVDCANVDNNLHVGGVARSHIIWHTIRFSGGNWQSSFGNVNAQESNGNLRFTDVGLGGVVG